MMLPLVDSRNGHEVRTVTSSKSRIVRMTDGLSRTGSTTFRNWTDMGPWANILDSERG